MGVSKRSVGQALLVFLYLSVAVTSLTLCEARGSRRRGPAQHPPAGLRRPGRSPQPRASKKLLQPVRHPDDYSSSDPYYVGSPFSMPPYQDVVGSPSPSSSPAQDGEPLYCINPPPPWTGLPAPAVYSPPSPPEYTPTPGQPELPPNPPSPPGNVPAPVVGAPSPAGVVPSPPEYVPSPPEGVPSPAGGLPSPPGYVPSPVGVVPSPPEYIPSPVGVVPSPPEYVPSPFGVVPSPPEGVPTPVGVVPSPPEGVPSPVGVVPSPPENVPGPVGVVPSPPEYVPSPVGVVPSPPEYVPSPLPYIPNPPSYVPGPPEYVPSPPSYVFEPPVVYPPPSVPPPPPGTLSGLYWCVAKPAVPDPIIQEAMNYACASGADCDSIQPNGSCYQPDTLINHASYAFNSYWQRTRAAGGTCDFGGTGMLITRDPSFDGCHFITIALQGIDGGE